MVVFSPWAFGTTQEWAMWVMNGCGYALGAFLLLKWGIRSAFNHIPERWDKTAKGRPFLPGDLLTRLLGGTSLAFLGYCLLSTINARAIFVPDEPGFQYRDAIGWLPHSYNSTASWQTFWNYLALTFDFWAVRDWLLTKSKQECSLAKTGADNAPRLPIRLKRLLWVLSINGAMLALEGLLQRAMGTNKLLWIIQPWINKEAEAQFGPYAYRSNGAQYLLLVWPVALGFWWALFRSVGTRKNRLRFHNYLLPCILVIAIAPFASLSRGAAIIGATSIVAAILIVLKFGQRVRAGMLVGTAAVLLGSLILGALVEWDQLTKRFGPDATDSGRMEIWQNTWKIFKEFPAYGTGPGTFESVYLLYYKPSPKAEWQAYAHCDWLELLATFGVVGAVLVLASLGLALAHPFFGERIRASRSFTPLLSLGLATCLAFAVIDFPFVIYSILFTFVVICSLLTCMSQRK